MSQHDLNMPFGNWLNLVTVDGVVSDAEQVRTWRKEVLAADRALVKYRAAVRKTTSTRRPPGSPPTSLLTVDGAAALLKVPPATIRSWIASGRLQDAASAGNPVAIPRSAVERLKRSKNAPTRRITKGRRG